MKILYGIQGTGHGHISRAREVLPILQKRADVEVLISGYNCKLRIDGFPTVHKRGVSFQYDSNGNVDVLKTAMSLKPVEFIQDVRSLDLSPYDLVISDFEPVTAWAAQMQNRECVLMSHQAAFLSPLSPRPASTSLVAEQVMRHFAPGSTAIGFHFKRYDTFIEPPVIRKQIRDLSPVQGEHVTVYLPAFDHQTLISILSAHTERRWVVFSAYADAPMEKGNVRVEPVSNERFLESLESSWGVLTSGGFETCAEAMYLDKRLMVMPIRNQYEQLCNAAALQQMGIPVLGDLGVTPASRATISEWLRSAEVVRLEEHADVESIVDRVLQAETVVAG